MTEEIEDQDLEIGKDTKEEKEEVRLQGMFLIHLHLASPKLQFF